MYDLSYFIANWNIFSHDQAPAPKSGIDLVLLFDLPDEVSLMRAEGRMCKGFMTNLNWLTWQMRTESGLLSLMHRLMKFHNFPASLLAKGIDIQTFKFIAICQVEIPFISLNSHHLHLSTNKLSFPIFCLFVYFFQISVFSYHAEEWKLYVTT